MSSPPARTKSPPIEDFLATVLLVALFSRDSYRTAVWVEYTCAAWNYQPSLPGSQSRPFGVTGFSYKCIQGVWLKNKTKQMKWGICLSDPFTAINEEKAKGFESIRCLTWDFNPSGRNQSGMHVRKMYVNYLFFANEICAFGLRVVFNAFWIFVATILLNTKSFSTATRYCKIL